MFDCSTFMCFFFFSSRRRHTRLVRDWSSDVCSSDLTEERPVTDHSWDYGLSFKFATMDDHIKYQSDDPHHVEFVASFKDWWEKVLVMDLG